MADRGDAAEDGSGERSEDRDTVGRAARGEGEVTRQGLGVLLIEDQADEATALRELLEEVGGEALRIDAVASLGAAIERLAEAPPDVMLLDLTLPDASDLEGLRRLRREAPGSAIVVVTGLDDEEMALAALEEGAEDYLVKGRFGGDTLLRAVRYADSRHQVERRLREQEAILRQVQKMDAVGRLAGGVAHDFNNLLTAINGYAELLLLQLPADSPARKDAEEIRRAGDRASALTRQLLAFSRRQALEPRVVDLNAMVGGMQAMLRGISGREVVVATRLAPRPGRVRADPGQLEQVILNLVVNARDALPDGGTITLETADVDLGREAVGDDPGTRPGRYVMLAVRDDGTGMDETTLAHLFEPFFTTKEKGKGTGLGLSTVYGIVKQSEGLIAVDSQPGRGSAFRVYLPRVDAPADEPSPPA
ncbi:MAG TPA: ATP-binding protein [Thermoanaerobaculia bacterium]|nr:ATP-binding protein [Thermoanaerobaculia bacterium]